MTGILKVEKLVSQLEVMSDGMWEDKRETEMGALRVRLLAMMQQSECEWETYLEPLLEKQRLQERRLGR
jgi:hypothetical protein